MLYFVLMLSEKFVWYMFGWWNIIVNNCGMEAHVCETEHRMKFDLIQLYSVNEKLLSPSHTAKKKKWIFGEEKCKGWIY